MNEENGLPGGSVTLPMYAEVLPDIDSRRLDHTYHYLVPEGLEVSIGTLVQAPLKTRQIKGMVVALTEELPAAAAAFKLKPLTCVLAEALIPPDLLRLATWLAETTICPVTRSLHTVWPFLGGKGSWWYVLPEVNGSETAVAPNNESVGTSDNETAVARDETAITSDAVLTRVHAALKRSRRRALPEKLLCARALVAPPALSQYVAAGNLLREMRFEIPGLNEETNAPPVMPAALTPAQQDDAPSAVLNTPPAMPTAPAATSAVPAALTPAQQDAAAQIESARASGVGTVLLQGVTGSGKTLVYGHLVAQVVARGQQAIVLVPEIALTSQLMAFFRARFGDRAAVIHSGIKTGEKLRIWSLCLRGELDVVVGARSAVFAPFPRLGLIVIDEEHDSAYKQDSDPKYHARDVARYRLPAGLVVLGSATPSLESFAAAKGGKIGSVRLNTRFNRQPLPTIEVVDMKAELARGNRSVLSEQLQTALSVRLERGEQSILFLNRRGHSTFVICRECGYVVNCPHCDVALTFHHDRQKLRCHYCNHQEENLVTCPRCRSRYIRHFGQGTQKVEEETKRLYPAATILRLDSDTAGGAPDKILRVFREERADILIGTQMLAKGLDFPKVTLVGVVACDQLLHMPDFRARERAFQLFTQVAGRAGRAARPGEVLLQTYSPEDRTVQYAASGDFERFAWEELSFRRERQYPPFVHLLRLTLGHEREESVIRCAMALGLCLEKELADAKMLGPVPALLTRLKNEYRWQISLQHKQPAYLREGAGRGVKAFYAMAPAAGLRLALEMDPLY
jgi:primosomal protein N' (replication factor Y)